MSFIQRPLTTTRRHQQACANNVWICISFIRKLMNMYMKHVLNWHKEIWPGCMLEGVIRASGAENKECLPFNTTLALWGSFRISVTVGPKLSSPACSHPVTQAAAQVGRAEERLDQASTAQGRGTGKICRKDSLLLLETLGEKGEDGRKGQSSILLQGEYRIHFHTLLPHPDSSSSHPHCIRAKPCG